MYGDKTKLCCHCCEALTRKQINCTVALVSGNLFWTAWWMMIDINATNPDLIRKRKVYYVPIIVSSIAFLIINSVSKHLISGGGINYDGKWVLLNAILAHFIGFFLSFCALISAFYIYIHDFALDNAGDTWPGLGILFLNLMMFASSFIFKFGTDTEYF